MIEQLLIGTSASAAAIYAFSKMRCYIRSCTDPIIVMDSNENEFQTITNDHVEIIVINKKKDNKYMCL